MQNGIVFFFNCIEPQYCIDIGNRDNALTGFSLSEQLYLHLLDNTLSFCEIYWLGQHSDIYNEKKYAVMWNTPVKTIYNVQLTAQVQVSKEISSSVNNVVAWATTQLNI